MGREKLQETPLTPVYLIIGMDVGHLPSPTPINERDSSSEVDLDVEHLPIPHPMRTPHGIALKMFMDYVLHFVHISSP